MNLLILLSSLLAALAVASPIRERAGGPEAVPIPANCTILNTLPHSTCGNGTVNGYMPATNFTSAHLLYQSYFAGFLTIPEQWEQCSQQCYGYGTKGSCKSVLLSYNTSVPAGWFGTPGGDLVTGCIMFDAYITPNDFVAAPSGQYVNETAGSIYCPS